MVHEELFNDLNIFSIIVSQLLSWVDFPIEWPLYLRILLGAINVEA